MISMRTALAATLTAFIGSSVGLAQTEPGQPDDVSKATTDSLCNGTHCLWRPWMPRRMG